MVFNSSKNSFLSCFLIHTNAVIAIFFSSPSISGNKIPGSPLHTFGCNFRESVNDLSVGNVIEDGELVVVWHL